MSEENSKDASNEPDNTDGSLLGDSGLQLADGEFFLSDGIKGVGDKPEWYDSNRFKSVDQQAKSYLELEKKFGAFTGAPKEGYELADGVDKEDTLVTEFMKLASEQGINQEGFDKIFGLYSAQMGVSQELDQEAELTKLGDNAKNRIANLENALKFKMGDEYESVKELVYNADSIMLAEKLIKAYAPTKLPIDGGEHPEGLTWADVEKEMFKKDATGRLLRSTDVDHNKKVERMMAEFGGDQSSMVAVG